MTLSEFGQWLERDWNVRAEQPPPVHGEWHAGHGFAVRHLSRHPEVRDHLSAQANFDEATGRVSVLVFASEIDRCAYVDVPWEAWLELVSEVGAQRIRLLATLKRNGGRLAPVLDDEAT